jgi:hypothetical protein
MKGEKETLEIIEERFGNKLSKQVSIIANERFAEKGKLKIKFYQSIIDGYINPSELWINDENVAMLANKINSSTEKERKEIIIDILDNYDTKDPKIKSLLKKYERYLRNI